MVVHHSTGAHSAPLWSLPSAPVPCPACEHARSRDPDIVVGSLVASTWRPGLLRCDSYGRHFDWVFGRAYTAPEPRP